MSQIVIKDRVPEQELLTSGHLACPGCGGALAMRMVLKELGENTVVVLPACCWSIIAGPFPQSSLKVPPSPAQTMTWVPVSPRMSRAARIPEATAPPVSKAVW